MSSITMVFSPAIWKSLSAIETIFLKITELDVADSGLYFCGTFVNNIIFTNVTVLKVIKILKRTLKSIVKKMRILVLLSIKELDSPLLSDQLYHHLHHQEINKAKAN
ncbi:unnamed protein product, partial [Coregonus sp. 'balchen']